MNKRTIITILLVLASFLCVTPQQLSRIRKAVTFSEK